MAPRVLLLLGLQQSGAFGLGKDAEGHEFRNGIVVDSGGVRHGDIGLDERGEQKGIHSRHRDVHPFQMGECPPVRFDVSRQVRVPYETCFGPFHRFDGIVWNADRGFARKGLDYREALGRNRYFR